MTEKLNQSPPLSENALNFVAEQTGNLVSQFSIERVTGGFSRNRRAIVHTAGQSFFIKEVDENLLPGDGQEERDWLAKDQGVMELLRSESINIVPEESVLSPDSRVLMMSAYPVSKGWQWSLPVDRSVHSEYIQAGVDATKLLETATFTGEDAERLSLQPYFRDKLTDPDIHQTFIGQPGVIERLMQRFTLLADKPENDGHKALLEKMARAIQDNVVIQELESGMSRLRQQPNEVFGHCDARTDNLTFNPGLKKLVMVDWNWASQTPRKFGSTEFLISVAARGADIAEWSKDLNPDLLATLILFWLRCCMNPELTETGNLRDYQAVSTAVAYDLLTNI